MRRSVRQALVAALGVLLIGACAPAPVVEVSVDPATVYGGFVVDPPGPDEVVLTLSGTTEVELTMADLSALATDRVTIVEPFVKVEQTFSVVALAELLPLAGIGPMDTVDTIALNDYRYRDDVRALLAADALLAVGRDGGPIPMNEGGPIRLVFDSSSPYFANLDAWNWSLRTIAVVARG